MAGLLAWAADVVGGSGPSEEDDDEEPCSVPVVFTPEQQQRLLELDQRAASLRRSIQDLRLRIPPAHIAQRLPDLHAHSLASSNALALQLNAHSATRQEAQLREVTLLEENAAYEKAISSCQMKIDEKMHEADLLQNKLKEMYLVERNLKDELEKTLADVGGHGLSAVSFNNFRNPNESQSDSGKLKELEDKKRELSSIEEWMQSLENQWALIQQESGKQPSLAQREKLLEKQLHSLVEQLTGKQAQAEGLIREIRITEKELEKLNSFQSIVESESIDSNTARNRFGRSSHGILMDDNFGIHRRSFQNGRRAENMQTLMLARSALVVYIVVLHVIVFIKISF